MTDEQIIKALECCEVGKDKCKKCPLYCNVPACSRYLAQFALDLIKRQQAEIERLSRRDEAYPCKVNVGNNCLVYATSLDDYDNLIRDISAEAIKEFAERLKQYLLLRQIGQISVVSFENIDNLVKEMTEESNGE